MAGNLLQEWGSSGQAFTLTIASLANGASRESTVIDLTSLKARDVLIMLKIKSAAASTAANGYAELLAYGTVDNGTTYSDVVTGTDAAITLTSPHNLNQLGKMNIVANAVTYKSRVFSLAAAFGSVPQKFGLVLTNNSGATFDATGGSHSALYQIVYDSYS